jgi:hypothetical protein
MRGNIPLSDLPQGREVWLIVCVSGVSYSVTKTGRRYIESNAYNGTGHIKLKCWCETLERFGQLRAGLYGLTGAFTLYREEQQFVLSSFSPIDAAIYREYQHGEPRRSGHSGKGLSTALPPKSSQFQSTSRRRPSSRASKWGAKEFVFGIDENGSPSGERELLESLFSLLQGEYDPAVAPFEVGADDMARPLLNLINLDALPGHAAAGVGRVKSANILVRHDNLKTSYDKENCRVSDNACF